MKSVDTFSFRLSPQGSAKMSGQLVGRNVSEVDALNGVAGNTYFTPGQEIGSTSNHVPQVARVAFAMFRDRGIEAGSGHRYGLLPTPDHDTFKREQCQRTSCIKCTTLFRLR